MPPLIKNIAVDDILLIAEWSRATGGMVSDMACTLEGIGIRKVMNPQHPMRSVERSRSCLCGFREGRTEDVQRAKTVRVTPTPPFAEGKIELPESGSLMFPNDMEVRVNLEEWIISSYDRLGSMDKA